jgi:hypothetical protein
VAPRRLTRTSDLVGPAPRPRRRWLFAALCAMTLTAAVAIPAIPAMADNGEIVFSTVTGDGSGNLTVTVESDFPLQSVTVHLWSGGSDTGTDVLDLTDFTDTSTFAFDAPQTYVLANPSADLATLAPGTYTATADATDTNSPTPDVVTDQPLTGSFGYVSQPVVTLANAITPSFSTTQPDQPVTISGTLTCSTLACPVGGWPASTVVTVTDQTASGQPTWTGNPDSGGAFSVSNVTGVPGDEYVASVAAVPQVSNSAASGTSQDLPQYLQAAITATANPAPYGLQSITGFLRYPSGSFGWTGVAGVVITATAAGQTPIDSQPTLADGSFSLMLPKVPGTTQWQLSSPVDDLASTPFLMGADTPIDATQLWPTAISGFYAQVNKGMRVTVGGCLATSVSPAPKDDPVVQIQYRTSTTAAWNELGTVASMSAPGCTGVVFSGAGPAPGPREYYRASFPGDSAYQAATSSSVLAGLTQVRYYHFAVTPHTVTAGQKITVSGKLQYLSGKTWRAYANQKVLIAFSKRASNTIWYEAKWVKTNKKGAFSTKFADNAGTEYWSADFAGNSTHYTKWAPSVKVTSHGKARTARTVPAGPPVRIYRPQAGALWQFVLVSQPLVALLRS